MDFENKMNIARKEKTTPQLGWPLRVASRPSARATSASREPTGLLRIAGSQMGFAACPVIQIGFRLR
jgi:hypothetical protein